MSEQTPSIEQHDARPEEQTAHEGSPTAAAQAAAPAPPAAAPAPPTPRPAAPGPAAPSPAVPSPAALAGLHAPGGHRASEFGRVDDTGTVFVRTPEGEREVGSYPGATPAEALAYFTRKYDELLASAELLLQRVTHTDLAAKEAAEALAKLHEQTTQARVVGDLAALEAKVQAVEAAVQAKRSTEDAERRAAREVGRAKREALVAEAESIAGQPEHKVQWKASGARMRALLDEWKALQRSGPKLDRESETALWQRFSTARNGFDKARRVHFAQLEGSQSEAKAAKKRLVAEAEELATSTDWAPTATAFKRLMDRWRDAGRASRTDDDALWARFKAAQDSFFAAKDEVVAAENEEYKANLVVKEELLAQAQALLPVTDVEAAKASLRRIQDAWDAAGKVPRGDLERVEKAMRRVEQTVRETDEKRWANRNPEAAARAQSLVDQLESAVEGLRADLTRAEATGNARKTAEARAALEAREQWLAQARAGLEEFSS